MLDHVSSESSTLRPTSLSLTAESPKMRLTFEKPDDGTTLIRTVSGPNPPTTIEIRFEPMSPTEQLVGQPTAWCNAPSAGQALVYNVPVPSPGAITSGTLTVTASISGAGIQVPIKIKHNL
jgi:hypothetical protein